MANECEYKIDAGFPPEWCDHDAEPGESFCKHHLRLSDSAGIAESIWEMETER